MSEVAELLGEWALSTGATFSLLRWDESRLGRARLARAWPPSSKLSAAVLFGPWCLPIHFYRTRLALRGWTLAAAWLATVAVVVAALAALDARSAGAGEAMDTAFFVACGVAILYAEAQVWRARMRARATRAPPKRPSSTPQSTLEQGR